MEAVVSMAVVHDVMNEEKKLLCHIQNFKPVYMYYAFPGYRLLSSYDYIVEVSIIQLDFFIRG